jgi:hypothetical protein
MHLLLKTHAHDALLQKIDDNKYDDGEIQISKYIKSVVLLTPDRVDLRALPYVNASYKAFGESGYLKGTRIDLICDVQDWAGGPAGSKFFILSGAAGTGKSTVVCEVSHRLEAEGQLGASFFFVRGDTGALGSTQSVFPTIAFQLASLQSTLRPYIATAAREFMKFQPRSLKEQSETLLLAPLATAQREIAELPKKTIVIVLDALDEANGDLGGFLVSLKELLDKQDCFRVLITTRPESSVLHALCKADIIASAHHFDMERIDRNVVDGDIRHFFKAGFDELRWRDALYSAHPNAIEVLTKRAEGLFIYARTVINHLTVNKPEKALHRLVAIMDDGLSPAGLSALDRLYTSVLENAYDKEDMQIPNVRKRVSAVLAGLVILQEQVTIKILAPLMGVTEGDAVRTVEELRSIISCSGPDLRNDVIRPLHLTFREFLVDKERCKNSDFFADRQLHHFNVAEVCLRITNRELHRDMCGLGDRHKDEVNDRELIVRECIPPHVQYACISWCAHVVESEPSAEFRRLLGLFCREKLLEWIETMSLMNFLHLVMQALLAMHSWTKVSFIVCHKARLLTRSV